MSAVMVVIYVPNEESIVKDSDEKSKAVEGEKGEDGVEVPPGSEGSAAAFNPSVSEAGDPTSPESEDSPLIVQHQVSEPEVSADSLSASNTQKKGNNDNSSDSVPGKPEDTTESNAESRSEKMIKFSLSQEDTPVDENRYTIECYPLEQALQDILEKLKITRDSWIKTDDKNFWQVSFIIPTADCDRILKQLAWIGIGNTPYTSVSLFPADIHYEGAEVVEEEDLVKGEMLSKKSVGEENSEFLKSIKSRLTVAQVVESVKNSAAFTFDFLILIILASIIAALGLAEDSSVVLVASMLVSPLMGPIMGGTFGVVIRNSVLWKLGVKNELIGLGICVLVGFLFGLIMAVVNLEGANWGSSGIWPTSEMYSRGQARSLWVGILIALPSGAGVALSILGGNTGSLVGVAISASLLPPAVNAGMLWAYAIVTGIHSPPVTPYEHSEVNSSVVNSTELPPPVSYTVPNCPQLLNNNYEFVYRCNMASEAAILGTFSLLLTLLNIACIIMMGIIVLWIKEVVPDLAVSDDLGVFWKKDIKIARDVYKTLKGQEQIDLAKMAKQMAQEIKEKEDLQKQATEVISDLQHSATFQNIVDRGPMTKRPVALRQMSLQFHQTLPDDECSPLEFSPLPFGRFSFFPQTIQTPGSPTFEKGPFQFPRKRHMTGRREPHYKHQMSAPAHLLEPSEPLHRVPTIQGRFEITAIQEDENERKQSLKSAIEDNVNIDVEPDNGSTPRYSPTSSLV